ncbi:MAG: hypothetical protein ABI363_00885, partial [Nitrosospira sp.]
MKLLGLSKIQSHAGYIESWLKILKKEKRTIHTVASQPSMAHRYVMSLTQEVIASRKSFTIFSKTIICTKDKCVVQV